MHGKKHLFLGKKLALLNINMQKNPNEPCPKSAIFFFECKERLGSSVVSWTSDFYRSCIQENQSMYAYQKT